MRAVNLLPRESRSSRSVTAQNLPAVVGGGMGFVVVAVLAAGYLNAGAKVAAAQKDLAAAQQQLAATPVPPAPQAQVNTTPTAVANEQAPRLQAVSTVLSKRIAWDRILREVSLVLPDDVMVQTLQMSTPSSGSTVANGFTITGSTYSYDSVARLLTRIQLVPDLTNVQLQSVGGGNLITFSVAAGVKGAAAAPAPAPVVAPATTTTTPTGTTSGTSS